MPETPLTSLHRAAKAELSDWDGTLLPTRFGEVAAELAAARSVAVLLDLGHLGLLRLEGADTLRFCNGQFTNNIRDLPLHGAVRSGITDDRGRLLGLVDVLRVADDAVLVVTDGVDTAWFVKRYGMYIVFDDVEMEELDEDYTLISVQGPQAAALVAAAGLGTVGEGVTAFEHGWLRPRDRTGLGGVDVIVAGDRAVAVWQALATAGAVPAGTQAAEILRVLAGQPRWPVDMDGRTFVHELGLVDQLVSFAKGCYVGQEVINRMDTRGVLTRRLLGLSLDGEAAAGTELQLDGTVVGSLGTVVEVDGRRLGLAILKKAAFEPGTALIAATPSGPVAATVRPLPFDRSS